MSVAWPTRRADGAGRPEPDAWYRRLSTNDLHLLAAVMKLGAGRVPPWAEAMVTELKAKADDAPEPAAPAPAGPRPEDLLRGSDDFAAALAAAWPRAEPSQRAALRTVADALGIEVPAEPTPEPPAPPPERAQEPDDAPAGDQPSPETAPTDAPAPRPTVWTEYWSVEDEDEPKTSALGWANKFSSPRTDMDRSDEF